MFPFAPSFDFATTLSTMPPYMSDGNESPLRSQPARPRMSTVSGTMFAPRWASPWWLIFLGLALAEVAALVVRQRRVTPDEDWERAAEIIREQFESTDAVTVAPDWADPLLRLHLGDRITLAMAGRSDLAAYERLWVVSLRGHNAPEAPRRTADFRANAGRLSVERFDLGPSPVVLDLVDALPSAQVEYETRDGVEPCPWKERVGGPARGGLGFGPVAPRNRFVCDATKPWSWVGVTMLEDLSLNPRRCIHQHPLGPRPVSVVYHDVHLGSRLVLYGGLDYHHERDEEGAPVTLRVLVNGRELGKMVHRDGDGWSKLTLETRRDGEPVRGDLRIEVTTPNPRRRVFCWSGTIQDTMRREAP